jgi:hypothetical protein
MAVCCLDAPGARADRVTALGVPLHVLGRLAVLPSAPVAGLAAIARDMRADVLHCHHYSPFVYGRLASYLAPGTRTVYTEHGRFLRQPAVRQWRLANWLIMAGARDLTPPCRTTQRAHLLQAVPDRMQVI